MKIKEVSFENFKSFRGKHKLDLDNDKGIFFLTGQNEADLAIGANGAGKSTLFDAIYWCFYGKTLRGLHASNIRSWGHLGSTRATVSFEGKGTEHVITRSWNPNLLEISGTTVKQEDVDKLIGLNAEAFKHAVIMGQTNPMFFDLKPTDKLGLVSDVLDLSKWVALSEKTKNKSIALQKELDKLERTISFSKGKLAGLYDNLETTTHSAEAWEESNNAIVGEIRAGIVIQELNIDNKQQQVQDLGKRLEETTNLKASIIESMQDTLDVMHEFQRVGTDLTMEKREIEINCEHCKVSLESFDRLDKEGKCYICEQEVDSTHINKHKEELQDKTSKFGLDIARLQEQIEKADQSASELVKRRDEMNEDLDLVRQELKADEINFRLGTESLERHRLELAQLLKERGIQINQENDHLKSIDRISEQIKYAENSLEKFKVEQTK
ncbi:hypothetical protein CL634_09425, partial [bacterium]|nr:hypothetical protein [bacterium]